MKKAAVLIIILTILSKIIGFGREVTLSFFYGTTNISDAYLISLVIPTVIFAFIGNGISTGYIPLYREIENKKGIAAANLFTNNILNLLMIVSTCLIFIGIIFVEYLVNLFAPGFDEATFSLAVRYTKITLFSIYFTVVTSIWKSYLNLQGKFLGAALIGLPMNVIFIIFIYLSSIFGNSILPYGVLIGIASQVLFLIPFLYLNNFKYKIVIDFKDRYSKKLLYLAIPVIIGVAVNDINKIVDKSLASQIEVGGISALTYASTFNNVIQGIFVLSIITALYPTISKLAVEKKREDLKIVLNDSIIAVSVLVIPITSFILLYSEPIINLLYGRGAFNEESVIITGEALFYYSIGMLGFGLREVLARPFYALQNTRTPMINATIGVIINIILNIILSKFLGIAGLALATSISAFITAILMAISLKTKVGLDNLHILIMPLLKITFVSVLTMFFTFFFYKFIVLYVSLSFALICTLLISILLYLLIISRINIIQVNNFLKSIILKVSSKINRVT